MPLPFDRPRPTGVAGPNDRIGVLDIGSNSIRLVIYDRLGRTSMPIFNEKVLCALGRGVERSGRLNPAGVALALSNLTRFKALADGMGLPRLEILATAAVRDAEDGEAFTQEVRNRIGLPLRVISGEEEGRLSALGVLSGIPGADGVMGDLGGGSLELTQLNQGTVGPQVSLPLGPLRLMEAAGRAGGSAGVIDSHLASVTWLSEGRGRRLYLVGGSWRTLARYNMSLTDCPLHIVHNYTMKTPDLSALASAIAGQNKAGLEKLPPILRRRSDTLPDSAAVLERALRLLEPSMVVFSSFGLREGLLFDLLPPEQQRIDPLLDYCSELAGRMSRFGAGQSLSLWTDGLFAGEDAAVARLRHAACLLSDLGWIDHPDYRAEHALWRVLRMPFPGVDHAERGFLAVAAMTRYGGRNEEIPPMVRGLLSTSLLLKATVLGAALRLAHTLCGGATPILKRMPLRIEDERLVLCLPQDLAALAGDVVQRRLESLAKSLNRRGEIVTL